MTSEDHGGDRAGGEPNHGRSITPAVAPNHSLQEGLPNAELVEVPLIQDFLEGHSPEIDAFLTSAEAGSA